MNVIKPFLPTKEDFLSWIKSICNIQYKRPDFKVDRMVENLLFQILKDFRVSEVKRDDLEIPIWEPDKWKFEIIFDLDIALSRMLI